MSRVGSGETEVRKVTDITGRDRITVAREIEDESEAVGDVFESNGQLYEELEVFNHVTVPQEHYINSVNGYETFNGPIKAGDGSIGKPDAVTERVSRMLWDEFTIDLDDYEDIAVVDIDSVEVM